MAFPVTLNGTTYTLANFSGLSYVQGFPDALEDFVTEAGTKVTAAATSATAAATSATASATSATAAATSATAAAASATSAQASLDAIEGFYLGASASDPTTDLNGSALTAGDWYFNTGSDALKVYNGSSFITFSALTFDFVSDTTPQLGGNLDVNGNSFVSTSNGNIVLAPNGTGEIHLSADTGVGTTSPARRLDLAGNNNGGSKANYLRITDTDTSATADNFQGGIEFYTNDSGNENVTASIDNIYAGSGAGSELTFSTAPNGSAGVSERLRIKATGVVQFDNGISEEYTAVTSSSNATTVNLQDGTNFSHTLTENTTFTFSNPASSGKVSAFTLKIVQDASASGYTVTWPASVDWPSATAPTLTATASAVDYFVFITHDGGTTYYGFTAGQALG